MGIRSVEKRLAAELCFEAVVKAVNDYLDECRQAGRSLPPHEHLVTPIIRAGYFPPGLLSIENFISRERASMRGGTGEGKELSLPGADSLIAAIMHPYPTNRIRTAVRRAAMKLSG